MRSRRSLIIIVAVAAALPIILGARCVMQSAEGHPPSPNASLALIGFTTQTFDGGQGVFTYTLACQSDFDPSARMCDSEEILRSRRIPTSLSGEAWVRPAFVPIAMGAAAMIALDASGTVVSSSGSLDCVAGARSDANVRGLVVDASGRFFMRACNVAQAVACCGTVL